MATASHDVHDLAPRERAGDAPSAAGEFGATLDDIARRCFCLHARMTARAITRRYNAALAPLGLEITEFSLLAALAGGGAPSIAALAERLAFERTTLVRNLKRLAMRRLIEKADRNGRAVRYTLTALGRGLLERAVPLWTATQDQAESRLDDGGAESALAALAALRRALAR
ncbi:MAG: winged helix-turn-helix transcriptional regulator [Alphaproteobacteria bacterium]|nr:winged helix-turn-helix transcriptional regulator [Alphaproteobacteria bacterium]